MKIVSLDDNIPGAPECEAAHGSSLYVETGSDRLLIDTGSGGIFMRNAERLGVDLSSVTAAILSHGHSDHGGGIAEFFALNQTAKLYARSGAFGGFYSRAKEPPTYIGLTHNEGIKNRRIIFDAERVNENIVLLPAPKAKKLWPSFNAPLCAERGGKLVPDGFTHEQSVLILSLRAEAMPRRGNLNNKAENGFTNAVLIAPCAHRGMVNIMDAATAYLGRPPGICVAGFHTYMPSGAVESDGYLKRLAVRLLKYDTKFYACHCTGYAAYERLKTIMGDRLDYLSAGQTCTETVLV